MIANTLNAMMKRLSLMFLLCAAVSTVCAQKITHEFRNVSMSDALKYIQQQTTRYDIIFIYDDLEDFRVSTSIRYKSVLDAIQQLVGFYPVRVSKHEEHEIYVECTHKTARHLTGNIIDEQGRPVAYANVAVLNPSDSTLLSGGVSNESGYFAIPYEERTVLARISFVGYKTVCRLCDQPQVGTVRLVPEALTLKGVTVKGHMIRPTADGLAVNIENSPLASLGYASDVLRHLPFVAAKNDTYEIIGKGAPLIYINNRLVRGNIELKQLNSSEIKQVRVILNPGAEYDATVNAVIRITTIKSAGEGFSAIADGNVSVERVMSHTANGTLNYRHGGLDVFGTLGYTRRMMEANQTDEYHFSHWNINEDAKLEGRNFTLRTTLGANYQWNDRSSVGIRYQMTDTPSGHFNVFDDMRAERIGEEFKETKLIDSKDYRNQTSERHYVNAYCDYGLTDDTSVKLDVDYLNGSSVDAQDYQVNYGSLTSRNKAHNLLYAGRLLFSTPLWGGFVKTGAEASYTNNVNHYKAQDEAATISHAPYSTDNEARQRLIAGFVEYARSWGERLSSNIGARYEYTDFDYYSGNVKSEEASKSYAGFFPSASLAYRTGDMQFSLAYRYTTRRPSYFALRNAIAVNNPYSYEGGNPQLQPSKTNMLTLTFSWKDFQLMATYANVKDGTAYIYDRYGVNDSISLFQTRNVDSRRVVLSAYWSSTLFRIWRPELQARFSKPFINYGGKTYNQPRCYFEMSHIVEITPTFKISCELDYNSAGNAISEPSYNYADFYAEFGCIKTFWRDRLRLNLSITNLFNTSRERWRLDTNGIILDKWNDDGRRTFMLSATYRFNQSKSKYKGTASTSELNRL